MLYPSSPQELLARVPAEIHEVPQDCLDGQTPAMAARHVEETSCLACRHGLQNLIPPDPEPLDRYTTDKEAGALG